MKVWIVTDTDYDADEEPCGNMIVGVYSTEALAKAYTDRHGGDILAWEVDK